MSCVNCGEKGHLSGQCPLPRKDPKDQPCFICKKVGCRANRCPQRAQRQQQQQRQPGHVKAIENGSVNLVAGPQRVLCIDCPPPPAIDADGFRPARRPVRADLGQFIVAAPTKKQSGCGVRFRPLADDDVCRFKADCSDGCCSGGSKTRNGHVERRADGGVPASSDTSKLTVENFPALGKPKRPLQTPEVDRWARWVLDESGQATKPAAQLSRESPAMPPRRISQEGSRRLEAERQAASSSAERSVDPAVSVAAGPINVLGKDDITPYVEYRTPFVSFAEWRAIRDGADVLSESDRGSLDHSAPLGDKTVDGVSNANLGVHVRTAPSGDKTVDGISTPALASAEHALASAEPSLSLREPTVSQADAGSGGSVGECERLVELLYAVSEDRESARMAILKAVASKVGITDVGELENLRNGYSNTRIEAPAHVREVLRSMDLGHVLKPVNLFEMGSVINEILINGAADWTDIEIEVALDSGSVVHVISDTDTPCYTLDESPAARTCQEFIVGDGGTMRNHGQKTLNLACDKGAFSSVFQIAAVHRPLMSVGRICDNNNTVVFNKTRATVIGEDGAEVCVFERQPGGLYTAKLRLTSPFPRPEK